MPSPKLRARLAQLEALRAVQAERAAAARATFRARFPSPGIMAQHFDRTVEQTPALQAIDEHLVAVADRAIRRLMIFMPPQEGKSQRISCWCPLWRLAQDPTLRTGLVSYAGNKATRWGRWLRASIRLWGNELGVALTPDSRAADRFETTAGGLVYCVGIEGGITGEPADELIIDDPIRGRAEAESKTYRDRAWEWWESNAATRLSSRGAAVLMMTRWHDDDLAGQLLEREPGEWTVLRIPALRRPELPVRTAAGASVYNPAGELISVQRRPPGYFHELRAKRSAYVWRSVYDQHPVAAEGNLFKRTHMRYWRWGLRMPGRAGPLGGLAADLDGTGIVPLDDCWRFLTVDLAASLKTSADWTVAAVWGIAPSGDLLLLDRRRERIGEQAHWEMVQPLVTRWAAPDVFVERSFIGTTLTVDATRAGVRIQPVTPDRDKITRALPATYRLAAGRIWWPGQAEWIDEWCDEIAAFPAGAHDDQVDVLAYAVRVTAAHWAPRGDPIGGNGHPDPIGQAYQATVGGQPINFDTLQY